MSNNTVVLTVNSNATVLSEVQYLFEYNSTWVTKHLSTTLVFIQIMFINTVVLLSKVLSFYLNTVVL